MVYLETEIGILAIKSVNGKITEIKLADAKVIKEETPTEVELSAKRQLSEYFAGKRRCFDLPIAPEGSEFQMAVWEAMRQVPYGETATYGALGAKIGKPRAARAVGGACNRNPILIVNPCHRIVGKNGTLVGFACGLHIKEALLDIEKK